MEITYKTSHTIELPVDIRGTWTDRQARAIEGLCVPILTRHGLGLVRTDITSHSDRVERYLLRVRGAETIPYSWP